MKRLSSEDERRKPFFKNVHEVAARTAATNNVILVVVATLTMTMTRDGGRIGIANAPNFNFNVSHEGKYVALVSEPYAICGVDVAARTQLRLGNGSISAIEKFLRRSTRRYIEKKKRKF